jgi:hypothetical protein
MKICFYGNLYETLIGNVQGGGELQITILAKELAKRGVEVIIIDPFLSKDLVINSIEIKYVKGWNGGIKILRYFTHKLPSLYKTIKKVDADIYYARIRGFLHIIPFLYTKFYKKIFIYAVASDLDVLPFRFRLRYHYFYYFIKPLQFINLLSTDLILTMIIKYSNILLVQHENQKKIVEKKGIESILFPNLIKRLDKKVDKKEGFVFVGSLDIRKGFKEFCDIVSQMPELLFKVVGSPRGPKSIDLLNQLITKKNVIFYNRLANDRTIDVLASSIALLSTSKYEGFPNSFLEAWSVGTHVISLNVDPGDVIKRYNLGYFCQGNLTLFKDTILNYSPPSNISELIEYVKQNHNPDVYMPKLLSLLNCKLNSCSKL